MPTRHPRRIVAPLLVVAGAGLLGLGAGGIARVDVHLEAAAPPATPARPQAQPARLPVNERYDGRGGRARGHRGAL